MTQPPAPEDSEQSPFSPRHEPVYVRSGLSYTLASLLLIVTGLGVFLGLAVRHPAVACCLAFLCIPALIRAVAINVRRKRTGCSMSFGEKVVTFGSSLFVTIVVAAASGGTAALLIWLAVAVMGPRGDFVIVTGGALLGIVVGGVVGVVLILRLWLPGISGTGPWRERGG